MKTTTVWYRTPFPTHEAARAPEDHDLLARYQAITEGEHVGWKTRHRKVRHLGSGGQGMVYLSERRGADGFSQLVALKIFSPEPYRDTQSYAEDMRRVGAIAAR